MRKLLFFFFALLASVSGAWAASPAADVYPVAGKQYYLFAIQNDGTRSYLYNNSGTLATSKASVSNTDAYKWTVTVTDGSYKISNVAGLSLCKNVGSLGLGDATSFQLGKDVSYEACVSLWDDTNKWYVAHKESQNMGTGMHVSSFTTNASWSPNFIFEEVNNGISLAAGTLNKSGWAATWTASYNGDITFATDGNNNMTNYTVSSVETGSLDIATGSGKSYNYTLTVPTGKSVRYKIYARAISNDQTINIGNQSVTFTTAGNCIEVSSPSNTSTFTLTGENTGLLIFKFDITLTSTEDLLVTSLGNLSNNKAYVIKNDRAAWKFADDATSMTAETASLNMLDDAYQIAIIQKDGEYYLFSVNANKYLTAENTLTSMPTDNEQVDIVATENASYPWFFRFKNYTDGNSKYTKNINVSSGTIKIDGWGPDGSNASGCLDEGNRNAIIEAADFDATQALEMFDVRTVTYYLSYGGNSTFRTVSDVTVTVGGDPADFVPSSFVVPGVTFSYSPASIAAETTEVTVTATWNGPFNIAPSYNAATQNNWYVVDMHSNENNYTWQYDATSEEIQTPVIAKDAYGSLTDNNLWCFVGNPWDGFKIYNKKAGNTMTIRKADAGNTVSYMSTTDDHNQFKLYTSNSIANAYCFKLDGDDYYLNKQNLKLQGWNERDNGSSCRFLAPGTYHLAALNSWALAAPVGAVGSKSGITSESLRGNLVDLRSNITSDPFCVVGQFDMLNTIMNPVNESAAITLTDGYYRILSAVPGFNQTAAWYYNPSVSADHITWAKAATTPEQQVNSIFKFEASGDDWNIKSPNAQKYLIHDNTAFGAQTGTIGDTPGTVYVEAIGSAQHTLRINVQTVHANGHSSGAGTAGTLINWNANDLGAASTWYIVKVEDIDLALNDAGDGNYYATMYLPFDVTLKGASAYTLTLNGAKDGLTLSDAMTEVPAGTPVLLKASAASATATITSGLSAVAKGSLTGTYTDLTVTAGTDYFLGADGGEVGFYKWDGTTLKANRAYLTAGALDVKGFAIEFDDANAIASVVNGESQKAVYNLSGQRVQKATRGLYIVNGKKVVIK